LPQGDLAESWGISQDTKVYNFSLRRNVVWHDGEPVTSDDIIFTIGLMKSDQSIFPADIRDLWNKVEVKRLDDKTLQFRLPEPFAPFMDYLSFGVLPKHLFDSFTPDQLVDATINLKPVGSGPYRFNHLLVENGKIAGVVLQAFDSYYGKRPFIDQVTFRLYPDSPSVLAAYQKGEIMGIGQVTTDILPQALQEPNLHLYSGRLPQLTMVLLNLNNTDTPFLGDASIRRVLLQGVNRQWMVDHLLSGQAILANGPIFPGSWAYYDGIASIDYDPEAAIAALKKAGYTIPASGGTVRQKTDGSKLQFTLLYPDDAAHKSIAEILQRDWNALGFGVTLQAAAYNDLVSNNLEKRVYQAALVDLNLMQSPDPDPYPFWHQAQITTGQNYSNWDDRQASEYLEQARVTVDLGERSKMYRNFQVRFSQELPALPLFYPVYTYGVDASVQGVRIGPLYDPSDRFSTVTGWFLVAKRTLEQTATPQAATPTP